MAGDTADGATSAVTAADYERELTGRIMTRITTAVDALSTAVNC
ncbi:ABC transporter ATP-binding protein [Streptomyces griseoluteus]|nr:ABC transporter ATP-binding protein [Streptomyces griseoluteus]